MNFFNDQSAILKVFSSRTRSFWTISAASILGLLTSLKSVTYIASVMHLDHNPSMTYLRFALFLIFFRKFSFTISSSVSLSLKAKLEEGSVTLRLTQSCLTTSSTVSVGSIRVRTVTPSLVVTLLVGMSPVDLGRVLFVAGGARVVREAPGAIEPLVVDIRIFCEVRARWRY